MQITPYSTRTTKLREAASKKNKRLSKIARFLLNKVESEIHKKKVLYIKVAELLKKTDAVRCKSRSLWMESLDDYFLQREENIFIWRWQKNNYLKWFISGITKLLGQTHTVSTECLLILLKISYCAFAKKEAILQKFPIPIFQLSMVHSQS